MKKIDELLEQYKQRFGEPYLTNVLLQYSESERVNELEFRLRLGKPRKFEASEWLDFYESYFNKSYPYPSMPFDINDISVDDIKKAIKENKPLPEFDWGFDEHRLY